MIEAKEAIVCFLRNKHILGALFLLMSQLEAGPDHAALNPSANPKQLTNGKCGRHAEDFVALCIPKKPGIPNPPAQQNH